MNRYVINGENMATREAAYDEIARVLSMPDHFGRNLDALWDELAGMRGEIVLMNPAMLTTLGNYGEKLLATFADAAAGNPHLNFHIAANT